ncbi:hypothetical protein BC332_09019 [Capsicum chinense]|nr:hypothetical protein BC332_09019 [Capsicum chinense]
MFLILQIWILLNVSPYLVHCQPSHLRLPPRVLGPESAAFDTKGGGPYACVGDGRAVKYEGPNVGFTEFATTSPNRPSGGLARPVVTSFEGKPFAFPDALVIDQERGRIYFVDSGAVFRIRASKDKSYLLVTETIAKRIRRFWLTGPKTNTSDVFANADGNPDNIKRTASGDFWVAVVNVNIPHLNFDRTKTESVRTSHGNTRFHSSISWYKWELYVGSLDENFVGVSNV